MRIKVEVTRKTDRYRKFAIVPLRASLRYDADVRVDVFDDTEDQPQTRVCMYATLRRWESVSDIRAYAHCVEMAAMIVEAEREHGQQQQQQQQQ